MRVLASKILFTLAVGLLFGHQFISHHHHDDFEIAASIHGDHDDAHDHLPPHHVAHLFSSDNARISFAKEITQDVFLPPLICFVFRSEQPFPLKKDYIEIRPPSLKVYKYFSLRAPPAA